MRWSVVVVTGDFGRLIDNAAQQSFVSGVRQSGMLAIETSGGDTRSSNSARANGRCARSKNAATSWNRSAGPVDSARHLDLVGTGARGVTAFDRPGTHDQRHRA
jgi:hypothetical protein